MAPNQNYFLVLALFLAAFTTFNDAKTNPIVIKGHRLFDSVTKEMFFVKGVAYQPREEGKFYDPIENKRSAAWKRDIARWKDLGLNTIRVYEVDANAPHDEFMDAAMDAGIYLVIDLGRSNNSINRANPEYTLELFNQYKQTVDAFAKYDNVLGFFAGNEVVNKAGDITKSAAYVKALIRDLKRHMRTKKRYIPIGYSTNDDSEIRLDIAAYFDCGDDADRSDFLGYNIYSWCGETATFHTSGWSDRTHEYREYSVPVILSEYGCNLVKPRTFPEARAIFSDQMSDVFSGGIAYEYTEEDNSYGLVQVQRDGSIKELPDYQNLKRALADVKLPKEPTLDKFVPEKRPVKECPHKSSRWRASTKLPPTPSSCVCETMHQSLSCVADFSILSEQAEFKAQEVVTQEMSRRLGYACSILSRAPETRQIGCGPISHDAELGNYGQFSFCGLQEKLSFAYNLYHVSTMDSSNSGDSPGCEWGTTGKVVSPSNTSTIDSCYERGEIDVKSNNASSSADVSRGVLLRIISQAVLFLVFLSVSLVL